METCGNLRAMAQSGAGVAQGGMEELAYERCRPYRAVENRTTKEAGLKGPQRRLGRGPNSYLVAARRHLFHKPFLSATRSRWRTPPDA